MIYILKKKFLQLTSRTYPHGTEQELFHLLPKSLKEDEFGNLFIKIEHSITFTRTRQGAYRVKTEKSWFYDETFQFLSMIETNATTGKIVKVELIEERVKYESKLIERLFKDIELHYTKMDWDGFKCTVFYESEHRTECDRNDLLDYLPDLDYRGLENHYNSLS